jgi:hypothetical protein
MKGQVARVRQHDRDCPHEVTPNRDAAPTFEPVAGLFLHGSDAPEWHRANRQEKAMKRPTPIEHSNVPPATPVFASPWIALFVQLRASLQQLSTDRT